MRLITYEFGGRTRIGAWIDGDQHCVDLAAAAADGGLDTTPFASMQALIEAGPSALEVARALVTKVQGKHLHKTAEIRLMAPVPVPTQMRDASVFEGHTRNARRAGARMRMTGQPDREAQLEAMTKAGTFDPPPVWFQQPIYYKCNRFSVVGDGHDVKWPDFTQKLDYELELGIFLGRGGKDIPADRAHDHIFGYTIFNDVSARDIQIAEMGGSLGPAKGKDFDTGNVIGPCIVTADEIPDPYALQMIARVNGEEWSRGSSKDMHHSFEEIIAHISRSETLYPGEFIGSGTVGGGCGFELDRWPQPGDLIELEIEGIGKLRNRFVR